VVLIQRNGQYLFNQNWDKSLLPGFWEFPRVKGQPDRYVASKFRDAYGLDLKVESRVTKITHQITYRKLDFHALSATLKGPLETGDFRWMDPKENQHPLSTYVKKIIEKCGITN